MAINTRNDVFTNRAKGLGFQIPFITTTQGGTTNAALLSGNLSIRIQANAIGSALPATVVDFPFPTGLANQLYTVMGTLANSSSRNPFWLARIYKVGTLNLAATGDQFTHDAATFPVLRTQLGAASKPVTLIPYLYVTTATATTAPVFRLKTGAGGNGYTNQDGTGVVGATDFTFPNVATVAQSGFVPMLEQGDSGVQDITQINVSVAGSAGAATIYGLELLMPLGQPTLDGLVSACDSITSGLAFGDMAPAVATSGTVTSNLVILNFAVSNTTAYGFITGVLNA